jgi:hypothetical protein
MRLSILFGVLLLLQSCATSVWYRDYSLQHEIISITEVDSNSICGIPTVAVGCWKPSTGEILVWRGLSEQEKSFIIEHETCHSKGWNHPLEVRPSRNDCYN